MQQSRSDIIAELPAESLETWEHAFKLLGDVQQVKKPKWGLAMMQAVESVEQATFHVGELLVTECTVSMDGVLGYGAALGDRPKHAELLALVDAMESGQNVIWRKTLEEFDGWLEKQAEAQKQARIEEFGYVRRTLVNFEMMDEEDSA